MAKLGHCKACSHFVSDEAISCPECGQPRPYTPPPEIGSIHEVEIFSVKNGEDRSRWGHILFMVGKYCFKIQLEYPEERFKERDIIKIKVIAPGKAVII